MNNKNIISWIEEWFHSQCNGEWEHDYGVQIETLDNPGWSLVIDLKGTPKECAKESEVRIERNETDWIHCFVREVRFEAFGGPRNLEELLNIFMIWIASQDDVALESLVR